MSDFVIENSVLIKYTGPGGDVVIPDGVTEIGYNAFYNCSSLTSVVIPGGVTRIGGHAFWNCEDLAGVTLPEGLTVIGDWAFYGCKSLAGMTIPASVKEIGDGAFKKCVGLQDEQGLVIVHGVLYYCGKADAVCVTIPEGVTRISSEALSGCGSLQSVVIPASVTSIDNWAFSGCVGLKSVTIPNGVTEIGVQAFSGCVGLQSVTFPASLTVIGDWAFYGCKSLQSVTIPEGVTAIGGCAFWCCEDLASVTLPDSVTGIGDRAFAFCSNLKSVTLPAGVTSIEEEVFSWCGSLQSVTLPAGLTRIERRAFDNCRSLQKVTFPGGVTEIGDLAFSGCESLTSVTIPESVTTIGLCAFSGCKSLTSVCFEKKYPALGADVFSGCRALRVPLDEVRTDAPLPAQLAWYCPKLTDEARAYIILFQTAKAWKDTAKKGVTAKNADAAVSAAAALISRQKKLSAKAGTQAVEFALERLGNVSAQTLQELAAALAEKKCKKALAKLLADPAAAAKLGSERAAPKNPVEELVQKNWVFDDDVKKLLSLIKTGVRYAGSEEVSSPEAVVFVMTAYARQVPNDTEADDPGLVIRADKAADDVAASLERSELLALLEQLVYEKNEPRAIAALARYGGERQAEELIKAAKSWRASRRVVAELALILSDTRAAMLYMEKAGRLKAYAKMRGTDAETLRDTVLADFGFDANGKKRYDLGDKTVTASVGPDLKIALFDETVGKTVKSLPKNGADPEKYAVANADLSDLKKNVKKVAKARNDRLFGDFLSGHTSKAENWRRAYLANPVLHRVAELLIWSQGKTTFILGPDGPVKSDGDAYTITDAPIGVAYPMEMAPTEARAWQNYFVANGLKQPFEQVWEPVTDPASIRPERYEGQKVSVFRFMHMERHGIDFYDEDFHNEIYFGLDGCQLEHERTTWHRHEIAQDETFTLGKFSFKKYTRQVNHIVALLDRWTVAGRILKDDVSVRDVLDGFTAAQIMEYIRLASENTCPNCAAMLLEYKQAHYPDFDPMAEFTLE